MPLGVSGGLHWSWMAVSVTIVYVMSSGALGTNAWMNTHLFNSLAKDLSAKQSIALPSVGVWITEAELYGPIPFAVRAATATCIWLYPCKPTLYVISVSVYYITNYICWIQLICGPSIWCDDAVADTLYTSIAFIVPFCNVMSRMVYPVMIPFCWGSCRCCHVTRTELADSIIDWTFGGPPDGTAEDKCTDSKSWK